MLRPVMARGEIKLIGATTTDEYRKFIKADGALDRRFQLVKVPEPTVEDCIDILKGLRETYQNFHGVFYTDESLESCVKLSVRYQTEKFLPDKAIDLMDESGAFIKSSKRIVIPDMQNYRKVLQSHKKLGDAIRHGNIE